MQYEVNFGRMGKASKVVPGPAFRVAVLGDFSGRANAGVLETGARLASRKPLKMDVDQLEPVMERLKLKIAIPVDADQVITVPIGSMDDFHPDQLAENLPVFEELLQLRRNVQSKAGFDRAAKQIMAWSGEEMLPPVASRRARGSVVALDRKQGDFARLTGRKPADEVETEDLIRRLVGPYVVPARDSRQDALIARVDAALSDAMRRVLHHPDFQAAEALWRGVEFLVRRIETDAKLQIVLYDISAEELAADLDGAEDLSTTALYSLLVEQPGMDANQGAISMIAALYQFEATPPHADLLGRLAQVAAAAGAPVVTGIGPGQLTTPLHEWHPLMRDAWTALQALPASHYLGLAAPRFLLRMPYGKKSDPIDAFAFEEFTRSGGLSGMLWGHPAVLAAQLMAETWRRDSKAMKLGSIAVAGDIPIYVYTDADGDQIALPCTERHYSERVAAQVASTGVNPVISLRGRPEVRLGGFNAMSGGVLAGRWAPFDATPPKAAPAPAPTPAPAAARPTPPPVPAPNPVAEAAAEAEAAAAEDDLDALLAGLSTPEPAPAAPAADPVMDDLDALLAGLSAEPPPAAADETEPDLDALLASLQ